MDRSASEQWQGILDEFLMSAKRPLVVLVGPTASGKTAFSLEIALWMAGARSPQAPPNPAGAKYFAPAGLECMGAAEIINADSRQLYRLLDIGTGKILERDMRSVPHHLFSVLDPKQGATIAWYQREAANVIDAIHSRGNIPLLVGGSMLYVSAIIDGLNPVAASDPALRRKLEDEYEEDGGASLHAELTAIDPKSATATPVQNKVYLIRALEIFRLTGKPKSAQKQRSVVPYDLCIFGLDVDRHKLKSKIERRVEKMFADGWIEEVRSLLERGYGSGDPGMKSVGYGEIALALSDHGDPLSVRKEIIAKTRRYAKRQMTWWNRDPRIRWIHM